MAKMTIAQIISHPRFLKAFLEELTVRSALIRSGIAAPDPAIAATIANFTNAGAWLESNHVLMPFVRRWDANVQPALSDTATTPDKTQMAQDSAPIIRRNIAFSAEALAAEMSGVDFVAQAAGQIAENWLQYRQRLLFGKILAGVFANNVASNGSDLVLDITGFDGDAAYLDKTSLLDAAQKLGDASPRLVAVAMHSATANALNKMGSISYVSPAANMPAILPMYNGRVVIIDDEGCSFEVVTETVGLETTTYAKGEVILFAKNAIALNEVPRKNPFGADRQEDYDADTIYSRTGFIMHPRGIKFTKVLTDATATDAELATATNWSRVADSRKAIGFCKLICKIP